MSVPARKKKEESGSPLAITIYKRTIYIYIKTCKTVLKNEGYDTVYYHGIQL